MGFKVDWSESNSLDQPASLYFVDIRLTMSPVDGDEKKIEENANADEFVAENGGIIVEAVSNETMQIPMKGWIIMTNDSFMAAYILIAMIVFLLASSAILLKRMKNRTGSKVFEMNQFAPMAKAFGTEQFEYDTVYKPTTV